jgi:hypothetical protein
MWRWKVVPQVCTDRAMSCMAHGKPAVVYTWAGNRVSLNAEFAASHPASCRWTTGDRAHLACSCACQVPALVLHHLHRAGLGSPQLKSATGPLTAHRDSCLVLPNSPMAPAAAALASPPVWQAQSVTRTTTSRTVTPKAAQGQAEVGSSAASPALPSPQEPAQQQQQQQPQAVSPKQALSVDYNYIK